MFTRLSRKIIRRVNVYTDSKHDALYREWYFQQRPRLRQFRKLHTGEDCFIIGNGPSLNKMDLSPLRDFHTFGLNKIYLLFDKVDLNLTYHVSVNPLVVEQSAEEFEKLDCPTFLSYRAGRHVVTVKPHTFFIYTGSVPLSFAGDICKKINQGFTVTYVAMQIAHYMGFQRVFLIGVDHSFVTDGNPNEKQRLNGNDQNHFDPNYFANMDWHLPDLEGSELAYRLARFHYARSDREILDATVGGKLNIFPKIEYEQALEIARAAKVKTT